MTEQMGEKPPIPLPSELLAKLPFPEYSWAESGYDFANFLIRCSRGLGIIQRLQQNYGLYEKMSGVYKTRDELKNMVKGEHEKYLLGVAFDEGYMSIGELKITGIRVVNSAEPGLAFTSTPPQATLSGAIPDGIRLQEQVRSQTPFSDPDSHDWG